jgi:hypothetical protein
MNFEGGRLEWHVREGIYDVDDATHAAKPTARLITSRAVSLFG